MLQSESLPAVSEQNEVKRHKHDIHIEQIVCTHAAAPKQARNITNGLALQHVCLTQRDGDVPNPKIFTPGVRMQQHLRVASKLGYRLWKQEEKKNLAVASLP